MLQSIWRAVRPKKPTINAVYLRGVIAARAGPRGVSLATIKPQLEAAFEKGAPEAVALVVNSPGGSPVQCSLIGELVDGLATKTKVPVLTFAEDVAASGGYWLLSLGSEVFCSEASIVGSIGVVSSQFGLHDLIARHGIERRVLTAGKNKVRLDPFLPTRPDDVARMQGALETIHGVFKDHVRRKRGEKIKKETEEEVFSGDFFVGRQAVELGLVDGIGSLHNVARERFGEDVQIRDVRPPFSFLPPWMGGGLGTRGDSAGASLTASVVDAALDAVEERLWRGRVGL